MAILTGQNLEEDKNNKDDFTSQKREENSSQIAFITFNAIIPIPLVLSKLSHISWLLGFLLEASLVIVFTF